MTQEDSSARQARIVYVANVFWRNYSNELQIEQANFK